MEAQKTALVTGVAGFVGSNLAIRLLKDGWRVIGIDNLFVGDTSKVPDEVDFREGHTKDIAQLVPETPDTIFHLGEYARVEQSLKEPEVVWYLNIHGTFGVLEFWRAKKCKLVYAGSSTKFADGGLARVATPYAWTKAANTEMVRNYSEWYGIPFATTYFYNVYGPGERSGKYGTLIEIFKQKYLKGEPLTVTSPGTQERIFTHVDDIVDGLMLVAERGEGDEFGLGAEESFSVLQIAKMFTDSIVMTPPAAGNRMNAVLDATKSHAIGWRAQRSVKDYIASIVSNA